MFNPMQSPNTGPAGKQFGNRMSDGGRITEALKEFWQLEKAGVKMPKSADIFVGANAADSDYDHMSISSLVDMSIEEANLTEVN